MISSPPATGYKCRYFSLLAAKDDKFRTLPGWIDWTNLWRLVQSASVYNGVHGSRKCIVMDYNGVHGNRKCVVMDYNGVHGSRKCIAMAYNGVHGSRKCIAMAYNGVHGSRKCVAMDYNGVHGSRKCVVSDCEGPFYSTAPLSSGILCLQTMSSSGYGERPIYQDSLCNESA
jgi:hypothetical protein